MMKSIGRKAYFCPLPVLMIGTYDENLKPNLMNAAWGSLCDYDKVMITLDKTHKTTSNILKNKGLTISFGVKDLVEVCDYVGLVSQNKDENKLSKVNLKIEKSNTVLAPVFTDFPLTLECELLSYDESTEMLICKIINTLVDERYLVDNKVNVNDMNILLYNGINHEYCTISNKVAKAFDCGSKLIGK